MKKLFELWKEMSEKGIPVPFLLDRRTNLPSITLFFAYVTFIIACISVIAFHVTSSVMIATWTSILFWVIAVIFYRLRKLDRAKIDFDDKSVELSGEDENEEATK